MIGHHTLRSNFLLQNGLGSEEIMEEFRVLEFKVLWEGSKEVNEEALDIVQAHQAIIHDLISELDFHGKVEDKASVKLLEV